MKENRRNLTSSRRDRDPLIWLGVGLTTFWLAGGVAYVIYLGGWAAFLNLGTDALGGFFEGFFAPLAFLWLVIGLFIQQRELSLNTEALQQTNLNSSKQTEVLEATELRARQSAFFQIAENVQRQTGNLVGLILQSLDPSEWNDQVNDQTINESWLDHQRGDYERFPSMVTLLIEGSGFDVVVDPALFYGTVARSQYTEEYIRSYRGLLQLAKECDQDGTITRTVTQTPHGQVYAWMLFNIQPPNCWVLLPEDRRFAPLTNEANFDGIWRLTANTLDGFQEWICEFRKTEDGFDAQVKAGGQNVVLENLQVDGSLFFARVLSPMMPFVLTGRIDGDRMTGQLDSRDGIFATFDGQRQPSTT